MGLIRLIKSIFDSEVMGEEIVRNTEKAQQRTPTNQNFPTSHRALFRLTASDCGAILNNNKGHPVSTTTKDTHESEFSYKSSGAFPTDGK